MGQFKGFQSSSENWKGFKERILDYYLFFEREVWRNWIILVRKILGNLLDFIFKKGAFLRGIGVRQNFYRPRPYPRKKLSQ